MPIHLHRSRWFAALCAVCAIACAPQHSRAEPRRVALLVLGPTRAQLNGASDYVAGRIRDVGGFARLRTALAAERNAAHSPSFVLSAGDIFYGSGPAAWSRGEIVIEPFAALGIDVCAAGPGDRAYGRQRLLALLARLPCAATAVADPALLPTTTLTRAGVRVSFVVLDARATAPAALASGGALLDDAGAARAAATLRALRASKRPDLIVALTDLALDQALRLARDVRGFDVIVAGAGAARAEADAGALVIAPGEPASSLSRLELTLRERGGVQQHAYRSQPAGAVTAAEEPRMQALVEQTLAPYRERARRTVAHSDALLFARDDAGRAAYDFIADALREAARADVALVPLSGTHALARGAITEAELWNTVPFDAPLTRQRVRGNALRAWLAANGGDDLVRSGVRVRPETGAIEIGVRPLRDDDSYWVTAPGLTLPHGDPPDTTPTWSVHEALDRHLEANPFLRTLRDGHVVAGSLPSWVQCKDQLRR